MLNTIILSVIRKQQYCSNTTRRNKESALHDLRCIVSNYRKVYYYIYIYPSRKRNYCKNQRQIEPSILRAYVLYFTAVYFKIVLMVPQKEHLVHKKNGL